METFTLTALARTTSGTRSARALRSEGRLPAIIYGHGETPEPITLPMHEVEVALAHGARTVGVKLGGEEKQYLIKEVQYDYLDEEPIHLDLTRVNLDERVTVRIGIELRGVPKGISDGGVLEQHLADLEVECLVTQIPGTLHPLVTALELGEFLLVKDLELPDGVVVITRSEERVASVRALALAEETEEGEEVVEETVQPEMIGRERKDEEAGEGGSKTR